MKKKVVLFGIGNNYQQNKKKLLDNYDIVALVDNDTDKQGQKYDGFIVVSPDKIPLYEYDEVLITISHRKPLLNIGHPVVLQLVELGIPTPKIRIYSTGNEKPSTMLRCYRQIFGDYKQSSEDESLVSTVCRPSVLQRFIDKLGEQRGLEQWDLSPYHRKSWEFVYIYRALQERGFLKAGSKGLVFAVGQEPLPAVFASAGCEILASDCPPEIMNPSWENANQYARDKDCLFYPKLIERTVFEQNVSFQYIDMCSIPPALTGFDFLWTSCALEHLGSIHRAKCFVERAMDCLRPGGLAVHTVEYNLGAQVNTIRHGGTVVLTSIDLIDIFETLTKQGHKPEPLDFRLEGGECDEAIDDYSGSGGPHFKPYLAIDGCETLMTSFGMIILKKQ